MTMLLPSGAIARRLTCVLWCAIGGLACNDSADTARDADAVPPATSTATDEDSAPLRSDDDVDSIVAAIRACPRDGTWHVCSIEQRFGLAGLRVVPIDSALSIPGITAPTSAWQVGRQRLYVAFFPSADDAVTAMASMDSSRAAPRGDTTVRWPDRATLLRNANVIAVLIGGTERQIERASNALLAGPPQP